MKNLTIRRRLSGTFAAMLLIVLGVGWYVHATLGTIESQAHTLKVDTVDGLYGIAGIRTALAHDYLALGNDRAGGAVDFGPLVSSYEKTITTDEDRRMFGKFKVALADYETTRKAVAAGAGTTRDAGEKFRVAFNTVAEVSEANHRRGSALAQQIDDDLAALSTAMSASFVVLAILSVLAGFHLLTVVMVPLRKLTALMDTMRQGDFTQRMTVIRDDELGELSDGFNRMADEVMALVGQVQRSGIRVNTSMTEIAATSKQQQATATEVAATTTQIGATSREISATSRELVRTMTDVAAVSEHAAHLASGGQTELGQMEATMQHVMDAAGSINAKLAMLNEKAGDINQVVTTITKVADQTNLLSLNAAIEAEKAGEYGRGFAVVSSEIRRLADQTAVATYDIEQMVKDIQSAVAASVMGMDKFSEEVRRGLHDVREIGGKLSAIIAEVQTLAPRFESVSEGMQMQATGAEQISEALVQLTDATQQTVESLRQSGAAIDELSQVSGNLQGSIARFKLASAA